MRAGAVADVPYEARAHALVGRRIRVFWPAEDALFAGTVIAYDAVARQHTVRYDDGDVYTWALFWPRSGQPAFVLE